MSAPTPTYDDELLFTGFRDSSRNGPCVTFALPDREALEAFIGCEGKRFMAVLVLIGDDELPVPPPQPAPKQAEPKAPKADQSRSKFAADLCRNPEFWSWIELRQRGCVDAIQVDSEKAAIDWMREECEVPTRADFDKIPAAAQRFKDRVIEPWKRPCGIA